MDDTNDQIFHLYKNVLNETFNPNNYTSMDIYPTSFTVIEQGREKGIYDTYGRYMIAYRDIISVVDKRVNRHNELEETQCGYIETKAGNGAALAKKLTDKYANKWINVKVPKTLFQYAKPENLRIRGVGIEILDPQPPPPEPESSTPDLPSPPSPKKDPVQTMFPFIHPLHD